MKILFYCATIAAALYATVDAFAVGEHTGIHALFSGAASDANCALLAGGQVSCWGNGTDSPQAPVSIGGRRTLKLALGNGFACALLDDGSIWCWGDNSHGQLGDGTQTRRSNPAPVGKTSASHAIYDFVDVSAGDSHVCAIRKMTDSSGTARSAWCWGSDSDGQIGNFNFARRSDVTLPAQVLIHDMMSNPPLENVTRVVSGNNFSCVELPSSPGYSSVACWGDDNLGELGNDRSFDWFDSPQTVVVPSPDSPGTLVPFQIFPVSLTAGGEYVCARSPDAKGDAVACWGRDVEGQLSDGRSGNDSGGEAEFAQMPQAVIYPDGTKLFGTYSVNGGGKTACAMLDDLSAACWGDGEDGQLGDGSNATAVSPVAVVDGLGNKIQDFFSLVGGYAHFCALDSNLQVHCWGNGALGQLGIPGLSNAETPQAVTIDSTLFCAGFDGR